MDGIIAGIVKELIVGLPGLSPSVERCWSYRETDFTLSALLCLPLSSSLLSSLLLPHPTSITIASAVFHCLNDLAMRCVLSGHLHIS